MAAIEEVKAQVEDLLRKAGDNLIETANERFGEGGWSRAVMDQRYGPEHATGISKAAVFLPDETHKSLRGSADAGFTIRRAHKLVRYDEALKDIRWYGIILTGYSDGSCNWEYLTDPNCVDSFEMEW